MENDIPRMVKTPWSENEIPFEVAAEVGTKKVITEHSTIGILVTTDGSISDIPRSEYQDAEERVINELIAIKKPFIIILNCVDPDSAESVKLADEMSKAYGNPVIPVNCLDLSEMEITNIIKQILYAFPLKEVNISMPKWINTLDKNHWLKSSIIKNIKSSAENIRHVRDSELLAEKIGQGEHINNSAVRSIDLGKGSATIKIEIEDNLFYKIIGEETGIEITGESDLMPLLKELIHVKKKYEKIENALNEVEATGYGIVMPQMEDLTLEEPEIMKQSGKYGVRLKASAPSIHMMKADIVTEVNPIVGSEKQSEELVMYLMNEFNDDPAKIWNSNIFGKSLHELVNEGLHNKLYKMPVDARLKLQETLERIINEGCGGLICFIL